MNSKNIKMLLFLIIVSAVWFSIGMLVTKKLSKKQAPVSVSEDLQLIASVQNLLTTQYDGELPANKELAFSAIKGMLHNTTDQYTVFLDPQVSSRFILNYDGVSGVTGVIPEKENNGIVIGYVFDGYPADRAGLKVGDKIIAIDGRHITDLTTPLEASLLINGPVEETVVFEVERDGRVMTFTSSRQPQGVVKHRMIGDVGYIKHYTYSANAPEMFKAALLDLLSHNPKGIIWDLRSNGGGSIRVFQAITNYFIGEGLLMTTELKDGTKTQFMAEEPAIAPDIPLILLVGEHTYSVAESSAAAIKEHMRGTLIGSKTYGKGVIQTTYPLIHQTILQLTIGKWLAPSGTWYHKTGVRPDIAVEDDPATDEDDVLEYAVGYF